MSIHKLGYSVESLQSDKIENLEEEFESRTKVINIKLNDMQSAFGGMQQSWLRMQSTFGNKLENLKKITFY